MSEAELFHGCVTGTHSISIHLPPQFFLAKILLTATGINPLERLNSWRSLAMKGDHRGRGEVVVGPVSVPALSHHIA